MSLVSGPGRATRSNQIDKVYVQKHVDYIKSLDTVRRFLRGFKIIMDGAEWLIDLILS